MTDNLRTELANVKGIGSAKTGAHHWLYQRITAVILLICSVWLIFFIKCSIGKDLPSFIEAMQKPYNIIPMSILVIGSFYHAMLGMRVVIEDYVSCIKLRNGLIILLQLFCMVTVISFIIALIYIIICR